MKTAAPGGHIDVSVGEVFGVTRRAREASGYKFSVELPAGVERLSAERSAGGGFGAQGQVVERFRCSRSGSFRLVLEEGRPWEGSNPLGTVVVRAS